MTDSLFGWIWFLAAFFLVESQAPCAQPAPRAASSPAATARGDAMFGTFLAREAKSLDEQFPRGIPTIDAWSESRPKLARELHSMVGLWPIPERTPLEARITGKLNLDGAVVIEKLHFQSRPGLYVTANLYRPKTPGGRLPAVLYVCGNSSKGRDGCKTAYQYHGNWYARNGYICLIVDTLQLGEIPGIHHGTYQYNRWWWQATGYTPAGVECWNGIRAIDYLCGRDDVDPDRIGVTGISGGGAATLWIAAADPRVACAVPISQLTGVPGWAQGLIESDSTVVLAPRGVGPTAWTRKNPPNYVERAHALVGRTVEQGRVWDVMATADWIAGGSSGTRGRLRLAGKGSAAVLAAYAVLLGCEGDEIVMIEPPPSHRQGPVFLDILRVLDVPEALGLLAPLPLRLVGARGESFSTTRAIYDIAAASASLRLE